MEITRKLSAGFSSVEIPRKLSAAISPVMRKLGYDKDAVRKYSQADIEAGHIVKRQKSPLVFHADRDAAQFMLDEQDVSQQVGWIFNRKGIKICCRKWVARDSNEQTATCVLLLHGLHGHMLSGTNEIRLAAYASYFPTLLISLCFVCSVRQS